MRAAMEAHRKFGSWNSKPWLRSESDIKVAPKSISKKIYK